MLITHLHKIFSRKVDSHGKFLESSSDSQFVALQSHLERQDSHKSLLRDERRGG